MFLRETGSNNYNQYWQNCDADVVRQQTAIQCVDKSNMKHLSNLLNPETLQKRRSRRNFEEQIRHVREPAKADACLNVKDMVNIDCKDTECPNQCGTMVCKIPVLGSGDSVNFKLEVSKFDNTVLIL